MRLHSPPGQSASHCGRAAFACWFLLMLPAVRPATAQSPDESRWQVVPNVNSLDTANVTPNAPSLSKALHDAAEHVLQWRLPRDAQGWAARRRLVEPAVKKAIGLEILPGRSDLNARTLRTHDFGDYLLENIVFFSRPGFPVTANVYRPNPNRNERSPAVLVPIGHYLVSGKAASENHVLCIRLAQLGFVVMTYDAIGHGERMLTGNIHHEAGYALLPLGQTIAGWMVWDSMRALDYLLSRADVDPERVGMTGNSGGGLNTLYTSALDARIRTAVIAGYTFQFNDWIKHAGPHCTCNYLPGLYQQMEWFEIAGLIAPRPLLMLQGERDLAFPVTGARRAGHAVESLYSLLGSRPAVRLDVIDGEPHAYSREFRERMYGWMLLHLAGQGDGGRVPEGDASALPEADMRLICDLSGTIISKAPSVVALARQQARELVQELAPDGSDSIRRQLRQRISGLVSPPSDEPDHLVWATTATVKVEGGVLEKVYFLSEIGQYIPGLLWKPVGPAGRPKTVIVADDGGKAAVARSGLVERLLQKGLAVLALDLRGRGETAGIINDSRDNSFQYVSHSVMWGFPLSGKRAFDLMRAVDFLEQRGDVSTVDLTVVGVGDDALPVLLAAAGDSRIRAVACAKYSVSFATQIVAAHASTPAAVARTWNSSAMDRGRIDDGSHQFDLGSVIPSILLAGDVADLASLIAPRRFLFTGARDGGSADAATYRARFLRVMSAASPASGRWFRFEPDRQFDADALICWLGQTTPEVPQ